MEDEKETGRIIVYGNYIAEQHIEHQHNYFGEEKRAVPEAPAAPASFNAATLRGFISAGLLTEDLMPAPDLVRGEKAMLAHEIAHRLGWTTFWPFFQQRWDMNSMAVAYSKYIDTTASKKFLNRLKLVE